MNDFVYRAIEIVESAIERPDHTIVVASVADSGKTMHLTSRSNHTEHLIHLARTLLEQAEAHLYEEAELESREDELLDIVRRVLEILPDPMADDT